MTKANPLAVCPESPVGTIPAGINYKTIINLQQLELPQGVKSLGMKEEKKTPVSGETV